MEDEEEEEDEEEDEDEEDEDEEEEREALGDMGLLRNPGAARVEGLGLDWTAMAPEVGDLRKAMEAVDSSRLGPAFPLSLACPSSALAGWESVINSESLGWRPRCGIFSGSDLSSSAYEGERNSRSSSSSSSLPLLLSLSLSSSYSRSKAVVFLVVPLAAAAAAARFLFFAL